MTAKKKKYIADISKSFPSEPPGLFQPNWHKVFLSEFCLPGIEGHSPFNGEIMIS